jgi:hypothetical protein
VYVHACAYSYDMLHNWHLGLRGMDELHDLAKHFADCIVSTHHTTPAWVHVCMRHIGRCG